MRATSDNIVVVSSFPALSPTSSPSWHFRPFMAHPDYMVSLYSWVRVVAGSIATSWPRWICMTTSHVVLANENPGSGDEPLMIMLIPFRAVVMFCSMSKPQFRTISRETNDDADMSQSAVLDIKRLTFHHAVELQLNRGGQKVRCSGTEVGTPHNHVVKIQFN